MYWLLIDSSNIGGIERHVATLATALRSHLIDARIVLMARHGDNPWFEQLRRAGLSFDCLDGTARGLFSRMKRDRPALVHTHGYKANILGRMAAACLGIPTVSTFHAGERGPFPVSAYQAIDEWTSFTSVRLAVSRKIQSALPFEATFVENFMAVPSQPILSPLPARIGFIGRMSFEKGPDRFCELARRHQGTATFHMWGDGPMRQSLESAYAGVVSFHGLTPDIEQVWPTLGLLVMPSRAEGLPMTALEALAAGVPILASRVGELPSLVADAKTGWLFDGDDLDAAAARVHDWSTLDIEEQLDMRKSCWETLTRDYASSRRLPQILDAYRAAGVDVSLSGARSA